MDGMSRIDTMYIYSHIYILDNLFLTFLFLPFLRICCALFKVIDRTISSIFSTRVYAVRYLE